MSSSIIDAFKKLNVSNEISKVSDHELIFNVSFQYLSKVKNYQDLKAFKNVLVSLINLDKYHKANEILKHLPKEFEEPLILEISYVYYKLGFDKKVIDLFESNKDTSSRGLLHILAQTYYKEGQYQNAMDMYLNLINSNQFDNQLDLIINQYATVSSLNFQSNGNLTIEDVEEPDSYDLLFNHALIELSNLNTTKSLSLLNQALDLCDQQISNISEREVEQLPIKLSISYIYQMVNEEEKSLSILNGIKLENINDLMIKLIIKNNKYSQSKIDNVNLIDRDLSYQQNIHKLNQKLVSHQYDVILKNSLILRFNSGTLSKKQLNSQFVSHYNQNYPGDASISTFKLLLDLGIDYQDLQREPKSTSKKLFKFIKSTNDKSTKQIALLLLTHLNSEMNNFDQRLPLLDTSVEEDLHEDKLNPSILGTLINIYESQHLHTKLTNLLSKVIEKLLNTGESYFKDINYFNMSKLIAFKAINYNQLESSSKQLFQFLYKIDPTDTLVQSILENKNDSLKPIEELMSQKPIEEILSVDLNELIPNKSKPITLAKKPIKVTKKHKSAKFSKNKVLKPIGEVTLDEERWIPLQLRSYYKPTKKDKKKTGGTQGDSSGSGVNTPVVTNQNQNQSSNQNKKKKKKGKK